MTGARISLNVFRWSLVALVIAVLCINSVKASTPSARQLADLRKETEGLFYHGFGNYMEHAFPEDELRPITCRPLTRDRDDPSRVEFNDALGNYSLTLIDSLSTLAILASNPDRTRRNKAILLFQKGIKDLVEQYGDGTDTLQGYGLRAKGFDLDSKVQVFETVIRGLGGLLSAHLFAVGQLPITDYHPSPQDSLYAQIWNKTENDSDGIRWENGLTYNGQLLRLAYDLGQRLIPAFWTSTGIPYPRVNLRDGIPFYANSPHNYDPQRGQCAPQKTKSAEVTETCSAGAGSLVLEFTVLSRLTGDSRFEDLAKRAFWAVWNRRSDIDLVGAGIDAETGNWVHSWTGIGAGIDSFFEYAFKSHVLLSSGGRVANDTRQYAMDPRVLFDPLTEYEHSPASFLDAWETSHTAIKRHFYRGVNFQHPHYIQADLYTGAARAFWVDSLSAYYPGLLSLSGYVDEAVEVHLLTTALWSRFSALPERYSLITGGVEGGLGWWPGRPEFIESTYYLYRATEDSWYTYVGEMVLRDIKRLCYTKCGWAGLQDVVTGEKADRMESFMLGETAKYLFLLFDTQHPLNRLDAPFVFSTEGHPLIIPTSSMPPNSQQNDPVTIESQYTCPAKSPDLPFSVSMTASRGDVYHAASLARLHLMPERNVMEPTSTDYPADHEHQVTWTDVLSPSNYTYFPWTLPPQLIPHNAISSRMATIPTFDITFPNLANNVFPAPPLQRVKDGILINSLSGLRLAMVQDAPVIFENAWKDGYRIQGINSIALGKDEKVFLSRDTGDGIVNPTDPNFSRIRDLVMLDIVVDMTPAKRVSETETSESEIVLELPDLSSINEGSMKATWNALLAQISFLVKEKQSFALPFGRQQSAAMDSTSNRYHVPAITPAGIGAAPLPDWLEAPSLVSQENEQFRLLWSAIYVADELCDQKLPPQVPQTHQIILIKRGGCSFSQKLANIPVHPSSATSLQLVVIVDYRSDEEASQGGELLDRPLLDQMQTTNSGLPRQNPLPMVMVGGGDKTYEALRYAHGIGVKRRYSVRSQGIPIANLIIV